MSAPAASPGDLTDQALGGRSPSLLDALLPIVVLIGLLALTIALFGIEETIALIKKAAAGQLLRAQ